jgi:hypothetical protein
MRRSIGLLVCGSVAVAACQGDTGTTGDLGTGIGPAFAQSENDVAHVSGSGIFALPDGDDYFEVQAVQNPNGNAHGSFSQFEAYDGVTADFSGEVTCVTVDPVNHRAWIGGVVTRNASTDPGFQTAIHQVGRDVWFRVLDNGGGNPVTDRSTFLGFEGAGGIITSAEYCAAQPWPAGDARTWPVTQGHIHINP